MWIDIKRFDVQLSRFLSMASRKIQESSVRQRGGKTSESPQKDDHENGTAAIKTDRPRDQVKPVFWYILILVTFTAFMLAALRSRSDDVIPCQECITNEADLRIKEELDAGDDFFNRGILKDSMATFSDLLVRYPHSPRALWGYARAMEGLSYELQSESVLRESFAIMHDIIMLPDVPRDLIKLILRRLTQFGILKEQATLDTLWTFLNTRFPRDRQIKHMFIYDLIHYPDSWKHAEQYLQEMITKDPQDCISMAMLGRFYSIKYTDHKRGADFLQRAIDVDCDGIRKIRPYLELSHAYVRLRENEKAESLHRLGAERGLFLSRDQRSIHNAATPLTARPWWTYEQSTYAKDLKLLEDNWEVIRDEGLALLKSDKDKKRYKDDTEGLKDTGRWQKLMLYHNGRRVDANCKKARKTCKLLSQIPDANTLTRGQIKFSVLKPDSHLWAHCGPTNCRIRAHLGLQIPEGPVIRVGNETGTWKEGKFIIFDDSIEHEVWFNTTKETTQDRLVLIVDFWHPDITMEQRKNIKPCF